MSMIRRNVRQPKPRCRTFVVPFVAAERRGNEKGRGCRGSVLPHMQMKWGRTGGHASEETRDSSRIRRVFIRAGTRSIEAVEAADGHMADVQRRLFGTPL